MVVIKIEQMGKCEAFGTEPESQKLVSVVSSSSSCCYRMVYKMLLRESVPRQVGKKSGVPEERRGAWGSQGGDRGLEFSKRKKEQFFLCFLYIP